jgi:hypothetical protein
VPYELLVLFFTSKIDQFYCFWAWFDVKFNAKLEKNTSCDLTLNRKPWSPKTEFVDHEFFVNRVTIDQTFYGEFKKVYFMGSEIQPGVMQAQKRNIQISGTYLSMKLEAFFAFSQQI